MMTGGANRHLSFSISNSMGAGPEKGADGVELSEPMRARESGSIGRL